MSATGNASNKYLDSSGTVGPLTSNYSYSFWYYATHAPAAGPSPTNPFGFTAGAGSTYAASITWDHPSSAYYRTASHLNADLSTLTVAQFPAPPINTWNCITVTWDGTFIRVYINGIFVAQSVAATNPPATAATITCLAFANGASGFIDGSMAEVCIWNVTLSDADVFNAFAAGSGVANVQSGAVVFYDPLNVGVSTPIGPALTDHNSSKTNTSDFEGLTGGFAVGGNLTTTPQGMKFSMSGGFAVGGNLTPVGPTYVIVMSGGIAVGGDLTSVKAAYNIDMTGGVAVGGDFFVQQTTINGATVIDADREQAFTTK